MTLRTLSQRLLATAVGGALAAVGLVAGAAPAQAAACSGTNGVTVVVQSSAGTSTRCAQGDPSSAMSALKAAGYSVTMPTRFPGVVCRIDGYPSSDPCVNMPPADAYWAFFHAPAGGSWTYSQSGASSYDPRPGSSVGFRFGSGAAPSVSPAAPAPAPRPTTAAPRPTSAAPGPTTARTTTTAPRTTSGSTGGSTTRATSGSSAGASAGSSATPSSSASVSASATGSASATASTSATPSPTTSATDGTVSAQEPPSTGKGSSGRLVGGGVLLLALALTVAAVALRRRRAA